MRRRRALHSSRGQMTMVVLIVIATATLGAFFVSSIGTKQQMAAAKRDAAVKMAHRGNESALELLANLIRRRILFEVPWRDGRIEWRPLPPPAPDPPISNGYAAGVGAGIGWEWVGGLYWAGSPELPKNSSMVKLETAACNPRGLKWDDWQLMATGGGMVPVTSCGVDQEKRLDAYAVITKTVNNFPSNFYADLVSTTTVPITPSGDLSSFEQRARMRLPVPNPYCDLHLDPASLGDGTTAVRVTLVTAASVRTDIPGVWKDGKAADPNGETRNYETPVGHTGNFEITATVHGFPGSSPSTYTCRTNWTVKSECRYEDPQYSDIINVPGLGPQEVGAWIYRPSSAGPPPLMHLSVRTLTWYYAKALESYFLCDNATQVCFFSYPSLIPADPGDADSKTGGYSEPYFSFLVSPPNSIACGIVAIYPRIFSGCLAPEVPVRLGDGTLRRADAVRAGDRIWNPLLRRAQPVRKVIAGPERKALVDIEHRGGRTRVTENHPVQTLDGWKRAGRLTPGELVQDGDGRWVPILAVRRSRLAPGEKVWNYVLEDDRGDERGHVVVAGGLVTGDMVVQKRLERKSATGEDDE